LILQLEQTIDVLTPLGYGKAIAWIDYGTDTNTIWKVVCYDTGRVRNFYDDDILVYPNEMDGGKVDENYFSKREFHETNQSFIKGLKTTFLLSTINRLRAIGFNDSRITCDAIFVLRLAAAADLNNTSSLVSV